MNVVKFLNKKWQEIPELENPAMACNMVKDMNNFGALINHECIMIFKGSYQGCDKHQGISDGGFVVAKVPKEGDITKLGVFWKSETAELFADVLTNVSVMDLCLNNVLNAINEESPDMRPISKTAIKRIIEELRT